MPDVLIRGMEMTNTGHIHFNISDICADRKCWLDWLKQEVKDNG